MAYNELTTTLYSKLGQGDGINSEFDREKVWGKTKPFDRPGRISDNWFISGNAEDREIAELHRKISVERSINKRHGRLYCAESVMTWEVKKERAKEALANAIGVHKDSPTIGLNEKRIVAGYFFYMDGDRPSEDEIDTMLDEYEKNPKRVAKAK